jgi:uncharacterized SAM-binding protein YcdF (DUF218 family)
VYFLVTLVLVWWAARHDDARPAQAIVVLGSAEYNGRPSRDLAARLDHAVALYRRRLAPLVVVTGGGEPGDRFTEAAASADYLARRGVPDSAILREVQGRSSWESLAAAATFLKARGIRHVLLVSDSFHSLRITAMASELGLDGHASPTRTSPITGFSRDKYMAREAVAVAVGRIVGFRREAGVRRVVRGPLTR